MTCPSSRVLGFLFLAGFVLAGLWGCGDSGVVESPAPVRSAAAWRPVADAEGSDDAVIAQRNRADEARGAMFASLLGELMAAIEAGGHAEAISVCADRAPAIAEEIAAEHGVRIGRTSFRLRNPRNTVPDWATAAVERRTEQSAEFIDDTTSDFATLTPIRLAPPCLACHGPTESLADGVAEALAAQYPADEATGFAKGDLRGWFWVEVPAGGVLPPTS